MKITARLLFVPFFVLGVAPEAPRLGKLGAIGVLVIRLPLDLLRRGS